MNRQVKLNKIYKLILSAVFAAAITVSTAFIKINTGINDGYIHLGDCIIYLCSCVLPAPYSVISAAVGGAIADVLAGAAVWAPFTAIIKASNVLPFIFLKSSGNKILSKKALSAPVLSGAVTVVGYFVAEWILYSYSSAAVSIPFGVIQAVSNAVFFYVLAFSLDKADFKSRIYK